MKINKKLKWGWFKTGYTKGNVYFPQYIIENLDDLENFHSYFNTPTYDSHKDIINTGKTVIVGMNGMQYRIASDDFSHPANFVQFSKKEIIQSIIGTNRFSGLVEYYNMFSEGNGEKLFLKKCSILQTKEPFFLEHLKKENCFFITTNDDTDIYINKYIPELAEKCDEVDKKGNFWRYWKDEY